MSSCALGDIYKSMYILVLSISRENTEAETSIN